MKECRWIKFTPTVSPAMGEICIAMSDIYIPIKLAGYGSFLDLCDAFGCQTVPNGGVDPMAPTTANPI